MSSISKIIKNNQLKSYFILAFAITWAVMFLPLLVPLKDPMINILVMAIGGSGPAFAAIILSGVLKPKKVESKTLKRWVVFLISFIITCALIMFYLQIDLATISMILLFLVVINGAIAAYIISGGLSSHEGIRELLSRLYIWKVGLKWYLVSILLVPAIYFLTVFISSMNVGVPFNEIWSQLTFAPISAIIIAAGYVTLTRGPLREEIGWRGFALPRLQHLYSPLVGTLILGIIWTFWHLPLHLNGTYTGGMDGFIDRFYYNIGITFLITWIYNHSKGSLLLTTILHGAFNVTDTVILKPAIIEGPFYIIFGMVINIVAIIVIIADKMWRKLPDDHEAVYNY